MSLPPADMFISIHSGQEHLDRVQKNIATAVNPLLQSSLSKASVYVGVKLEVGANLVPHGLGREPSGALALPTAGAVTYTQSTNKNPASTVSITATVACTATILVF